MRAGWPPVRANRSLGTDPLELRRFGAETVPTKMGQARVPPGAREEAALVVLADAAERPKARWSWTAVVVYRTTLGDALALK